MNQYEIKIIKDDESYVAKWLFDIDIHGVELIERCQEFTKNFEDIVNINPYYLYFCIYQNIERTELAGKDGDKYWLNVNLLVEEDVKITAEDLDVKMDGYDYVNPSHYQQFEMETIEMMRYIWGAEALAKHCEMCAFKYKMRLGLKPDQPIERDMEKIDWYLNKAKELKDEYQG